MKAETKGAAELAELFKAATEAGEAEWASYLDRCVDPEMRAELESLLREHKRGNLFFETPALNHAPAAVLAESSRVGDKIGQYEILALIGSGGMGDVYLARDLQLSRQVALKVIRRGMDSADIVRRFEHEERLLAGLNHPNIAQLYGGGVTNDGVPYFVMEHVQGTRIDEYCKGTTLRDLLELFCKVCAGVSYAHQHLVVHRDLKPSNILVTAEGEPKLLDFGIAKLLNNTAETDFRTLTVAPILTPEYASPEHVRGETITTASDVYSLGLLLYELLTGVKPYRIETRTPAEIARVITEHEAPRPSTAVRTRSEIQASTDSRFTTYDSRSLRGDLDNIVLKALRKEPERRYPSVAAFAADIRRHLNGLPVLARKDTFGYRASKFVRRHRVGVAAAALLILTLCGGIAATLLEAEKAREQRDTAERINSFLQRMLSFSNQSVTSVSPVAQRKDVTVNEMLDQITPEIDRELAQQPEVRAQVLRTIGSAYASQGRYAEAERNLRSALKLQSRAGQGSEVAAAESELGVLLYRQERFGEATELLEKAVAFYRDAQERHSAAYDPAQFALALDSLGDVKANTGDLKSAVRLMQAAFEIVSALDFPKRENAIKSYAEGDLGAALIFSGKIDKGEILLREAVAQYRALPGQARWELGGFLMVLGDSSLMKKQLAEAERYLGEGEKILRGTVGDSVYLMNDLDMEATVYLLRKDFPKAEAKAREALAVYDRIPGANPLGAAIPALRLAEILSAAGQPAEGEPYYRRALELHQQQEKLDHSIVVPIKVRLSQCLLAQNHLDQAESLARQVDTEARKHLPGNEALQKMASANLAQIEQKASAGRQSSAPQENK